MSNRPVWQIRAFAGVWLLFVTIVGWCVTLVQRVRPIWRLVPRVRVFRYWALRGAFVRSTETVCTIDEAIHDCNMTLQGSCPSDHMRTRVHGVKIYAGPIGLIWPRDVADWGK